MKKKILVIALIAVCLSIIASGTLAYFTDSVETHNIITTGSVKISIEEWTAKDGKLEPYPTDEQKVMPATTVSKIVTVKNHSADAFIRIKYEIVVKNADGNVIDLDEATKQSLVSVMPYTQNWIPGGDGWYYYTSAVTKGETTSPFFGQVDFSGPNITNKFANTTFEIIVSAEAVQSANNGESALTAAGWPAK